MNLQKIDIKILSVLQHDAAISTSDLAQQVHLSQSPCWRRVNKLEEAGLINRRVAVLDRAKLGLEVGGICDRQFESHWQTKLAGI
jgi:Lrp/AsnC family transcriptional regulator